MFLMIWVNDFGSLQNIPKWLKHGLSGEDYLGFSDLIFPWFLFVMGMSIPFSFEKRFTQGQSNGNIWKHIIFRTIALLILGLFHMNMEMYNHETSLIPKPYFIIICTIAFFMIWNIYPRSDHNIFSKLLPIIGMVILILAILIYEGKDYNGISLGFSVHWWGILGLIGWSYFIAASCYYFTRTSILGVSIAILICLGINVLNSSGIAYNIFAWQKPDWIPGSGGLQALTLSGVLTSLVLMKLNQNKKSLYFILFSMGITSLTIGLYLKNYFIISKISGTPTWVLISMSTALFLFMLIYWIVDIKGEISWYSPIQIAGTATLSCYLIPYLYYSIMSFLDFQLPVFLITGFIGLLKSVVYTFIIIGIAWGFAKTKIQLKI